MPVEAVEAKTETTMALLEDLLPVTTMIPKAEGCVTVVSTQAIELECVPKRGSGAYVTSVTFVIYLAEPAARWVIPLLVASARRMCPATATIVAFVTLVDRIRVIDPMARTLRALLQNVSVIYSHKEAIDTVPQDNKITPLT